MTSTSIRSWADADAYLGHKSERPLANHTRIARRDDGAIVITLHSTGVVTYFPRELTNPPAVVLRSGGWLTSTTKERLNAHCPEGFRVWSERGQWYLYKVPVGDPPERWPWAEGITIDEAGQVYNAGEPSEAERLKLLGKAIRKYVQKYVKSLLAGAIPAPSAGDCWYCAGNWGDPGHVQQHLDEDYFVPSLLVRAIEQYPVCIISQCRLGELWNYAPASEGNPHAFDDILARDVKSSLTRYLKHCLGIAR